jgi:hypothetical protein
MGDHFCPATAAGGMLLKRLLERPTAHVANPKIRAFVPKPFTCGSKHVHRLPIGELAYEQEPAGLVKPHVIARKERISLIIGIRDTIDTTPWCESTEPLHGEFTYT